ncbi:hypothetical protein BG004_006327 [Podila humilis]|nr:hypothetical protein BG004_006327 [Podila humilis]
MIVPSSYPVQGIVYMLAHPSLFKNLICPIFITMLWSIAAIVFGFAYLLKLQAHALIDDALFDRVLKLRGFRHVLKQNEGNDVVKCLRGVHGGLLIISVLILTLPLNIIPILGQILFSMINGWILTFGLRFHYDAEIRNISVLQSRKEAWQRRSDFTKFGSIAVGLEMVPLANLLFLWTNIVGAALWVADELEKEERLQQEQTSTLIPQEPYRDSPPRITPPPAFANQGQFNSSQYQIPMNSQYQPQQYQPQQQQQHQQQYPANPYNNQGSAMVPPKSKQHP